MLKRDITNYKDAQKELKKNGFTMKNREGSHEKWEKDGNIIVLVATDKRFSKYTWNDSIKRLDKNKKI